jgi:photosystem II stability/assembly factor-like uncharacterized protein
MRRAIWLVLSLVLASASAGFAGCGGGDEGSGQDTFRGLAPEDPGPIHVHGLGVNPADDALFIATHTGLYRTAAGERKAERVGTGYQDTMGFTVAGPNYFFGSGHPDAAALQEGTPPLLGLIKSTDAGKSWQPVSLLGEADFHVLRFTAERVYGYDASNDRLLVSADEGKNWNELDVPRPLIDLAANADKPAHLLATSELGLHVSQDGGETWDLMGLEPGLLAWPAEGKLYVVALDGEVFLSEDAGHNLRPVGDIGGEPAAFVAEREHELYVALHDGTVKVSTDGGRTWTVRSSP